LASSPTAALMVAAAGSRTERWVAYETSRLLSAALFLVARTGLEPVISGLKGRRPGR
jgi:hypothetical protein